MVHRLLLLALVGAGLAGCDQPTPPPAATAPPSAAKPAPADQPAVPPPPQSADAMASDRLSSVLAGSWRPAEERARDAFRHPRETLAFFGIKPGDTVVEITPGGGWYTAILAPFLKDSGHYVAAIPLDASSEYAAKNNAKYRARLQADASAFGNVRVVEFDPKAPAFGDAASADAVLTFRNVHNWTEAGNAAAMFKGFHAVLKPGGTLGVVEHRANAGAKLEDLRKSGYLPRDEVVRLATEAGFQLAGESEVNANPKDTKDYEKGVWTLPPNLALGDKDREKYLAIGESDRMTLKFVKPAVEATPQSDRIFGQDEAKKSQ